MAERKVTVRNRHGLHARPAAMFVQRASSCPFGVTIEKGGKSADAKSILSIMAQAIRKGDEVVLKTGGDDLQAQEALDALSAILTDETA